MGNTLVWEKGRQLKSFGSNSYQYNNDGIRTRKYTSSEIHDYILDGTNIVKEIVTDICNCHKYTNEYLYDLDGTVCGIKHNGTAYYFYKNLQGDVIAITDDKGETVARYTYDAWGKCTIISDTSDVGIASINPFRYRSYYYDTETELYYLQSRYYDPEVGRFINADAGFLVRFQENNKNDFFAYCNNSPINEVDHYGFRSWTIYSGWEAVKQIAEMIFTVIGWSITGVSLMTACLALAEAATVTVVTAIGAVLAAIGAMWCFALALLNSLFVVTAIVYYFKYKKFKVKTYGIFGYYIYIVAKA